VTAQTVAVRSVSTHVNTQREGDRRICENNDSININNNSSSSNVAVPSINHKIPF
jgi:hypothetical protein